MPSGGFLLYFLSWEVMCQLDGLGGRVVLVLQIRDQHRSQPPRRQRVAVMLSSSLFPFCGEFTLQKAVIFLNLTPPTHTCICSCNGHLLSEETRVNVLVTHLTLYWGISLSNFCNYSNSVSRTEW